MFAVLQRNFPHVFGDISPGVAGLSLTYALQVTSIYASILHINLMYMLCANYGSGQSMDCAAQSMDPCFAQQSMDCLLNPWIAQTRDSKYGSRPNH